MRSLRIFLTFLTPPLILSVASADPPANGKIRRDLHGDPLPAGAVARLGTTRFRSADYIRACAFSPDGKTIAANSAHSTVRLFDAATGRAIRELRRYKQDVTCLGYSPNGRIIASGSLDGVICLHEADTGKWLRSFGYEGDRIWSLAFTPDSKTLAAGGMREFLGFKDYPVRIWDVASGKAIRAFTGHTEPTSAVAISPDGKLLASASETPSNPNEAGVIRLWEPATGRLLQILMGQKSGTNALVFSPDSKSLVSGNEDGTVWIWNAASGNISRKLRPRGEVLSLAFSPNGKILAAKSANSALHLWDMATGQVFQRIEGEDHPFRFSGARCLAFSPDGRMIFCGEKKALRIFGAPDGKEKGPLPVHRDTIRQTHFASGGDALVTLGDDGQLLRWDLQTCRARPVLSSKMRFVNNGWATLSPDHKILACWDEQYIQMWDTSMGRSRGKIVKGKINAGQFLMGLTVFSPDSKWIAATIPARGLICVWDVASGKQLAKLERYPERRNGIASSISCLLFSPDGRMIASESPDENAIWLHDARTGKFLRELTTEQFRGTLSMAFSSDGRMLAASSGGDGDCSIRIWELRTGRERLRLLGHHAPPFALAYSGNNRWLASASSDETVRLWDVLTGKEIYRLTGHDGGTASVAFSPDDRFLATGGSDTTVLLWDMKELLDRKTSQPRKLTDADFQRLWADLAQDDAAGAYRAMSRMAQAPQSTVIFCKGYLKPQRPADDPALARLIRDLDSDTYAVREKAEVELLKIGEPIDAALRRAVASRPTLEMRRRIERLQEQLRKRIVRVHRAIELLERIGTSEARAVLETLAHGAAEAELTREAKASLKRITKARKYENTK